MSEQQVTLQQYSYAQRPQIVLLLEGDSPCVQQPSVLASTAKLDKKTKDQFAGISSLAFSGQLFPGGRRVHATNKIQNGIRIRSKELSEGIMTDLDMLESLLNCDTVEELHTKTASITKEMGLEHFLYVVQVNVSLTHPYHFIFSGYPKEWRARYDTLGYAKIDPTIHHCAKSAIPIIWDRQAFCGRPAEKLRGEATEFGLATGASFAVHGTRGDSAMLSLATSRNSRDANVDVVAMMGNAQLLACYLHEAIQRVVLSKGPLPLSKVELTDRERECLLWAAEGKTGWEIGSIISVSERTVTFHLQNAARKLGVTNRKQAISRALSMGLITP